MNQEDREKYRAANPGAYYDVDVTETYGVKRSFIGKVWIPDEYMEDYTDSDAAFLAIDDQDIQCTSSNTGSGDSWYDRFNEVME